MDVLKIQPINDEAVLYLKEKKIFVIADLHIGIEKELSESGVNVESQIDKMMDRIIFLCKKNKPKEIILLGDIKHNIPSSTSWERKDVKNFLETLEKYTSIHIIPGNHDGNIKKLTSKKTILHPSDGMIIENIGFIHGHRWPNEKIMQCNMIVMAHTHPTIMLKDRRDFKTYEPCWIRTKFNKEKLKEKYPKSNNPEILVIPAFNPLCGGIATNVQGIAGPLGNIIDVENSEIYLLDGVSIGKILDLK